MEKNRQGSGRIDAAVTAKTSRREIHVRPFPKGDAREVRVSEGGGRISRWLAGTRELPYRTGDHRLMIVLYSVKDRGGVAGKPREWTSVRLADTGVISNFDVHSDGTRDLALLPADRDEDRRMRNQATIVLNFSEEVRRRGGGGLLQAGGAPPVR